MNVVSFAKKLIDAVISFLGLFDKFMITENVSMLDMIVLLLIIGLVCSIFLKTGNTGNPGGDV